MVVLRCRVCECRGLAEVIVQVILQVQRCRYGDTTTGVLSMCRGSAEVIVQVQR